MVPKAWVRFFVVFFFFFGILLATYGPLLSLGHDAPLYSSCHMFFLVSPSGNEKRRIFLHNVLYSYIA